MKLSKSNPLVTFYLFDKHRWERREILNSGHLDLCNLFWDLLFKLVLFSTVTYIFLWIGVMFFTEFGGWAFLKVLAMALALVAAIGLTILAGVSGVIFGVSAVAASDTWKFIKGNYCPQIRLED